MSIRDRMESLLGDADDDADDEFDYVVVGYVWSFQGKLTKDKFIKKMKVMGYAANGANLNRAHHPELVGQPLFRGLLGPMWGGADGIRYETPDVYRMLSQSAEADAFIQELSSEERAVVRDGIAENLKKAECLTCGEQSPCPSCGCKGLVYKEDDDQWNCKTCGWSEGSAESEQVEAEQTYAQAQQDILAGLTKDGWTVKSNLKIPQALSSDGAHKLFFKSQAIYLAPGDADFGSAHSLHLYDIRGMGYEKFKAALERWTKSEAVESARSALRRLAGLDIYPDRKLTIAEGERPGEMDQTSREFAGVSGMHEDWKLEEAADKPKASSQFQCMECGKKFKTVAAAEKAQRDGCPKCGGSDIDVAAADEDADLWHPDPDKDTVGHHPGLPSNPAKKAAGSGHDAMMKAMHCPPGHAPKMVYGRLSCAPIAKA